MAEPAKHRPDPGLAATGRRKTAVARIRLRSGEGRVTVNGRPLETYFPTEMLRAVVLEPMGHLEGGGSYDIDVTVHGGGIASQAGAVRHGIARALVRADENHRLPLKRVGLLTRDPRMKERRKYGLKKARKAPQFSKR